MRLNFLLAITPFILLGCGPLGKTVPTKHLIQSRYPAFVQFDNGLIVSQKCLDAKITTLRHRPTGCTLDRALTAQIYDETDLLYSRHAGPALTREIHQQNTEATSQSAE